MTNTACITFIEDFGSHEALLKKIQMESPTVENDKIHDLFLTIGSRYFGLASLVPLKSAGEGFQAEKRLLEKVSEAEVPKAM